jgi:hypothetical protein
LSARLNQILIRYGDWRWQLTGNELSGELAGSDIAQILRFAMKRYKPSPYTGRFAYFQAKDQTWKRYLNRKTIWRSLVGENGEFHVVPGDHGSIMEAPHIEVLAEQLRQTILKVAAERSRDNDAGTGR